MALSMPLPPAADLGRTPPTRHEQIVKQTQTWVAQTFFGPMLKQMRDSPFKSDLMDGGRGGQAFQQMQDAMLAQHMGRGAARPLVNAIVRRIEAAHAYSNQPVKPPRSPDADVARRSPRAA